MSRNRPPDSNRRAQRPSAQKIDTPVLVLSALTLFFATLFATLVLLRPEASDPPEPTPAGSRSTLSAPRVNAPPVNAPPPDAPPIDPQPPGAPPVSAQPARAPAPGTIWREKPKPEPEQEPTLQTRLEQLGVKCAEGANCYPD
jgi:hypothetical protein